MSELYASNKGFKEYVDRYCNMYSFSIEQALQHAMVRHVADYYIKWGGSNEL